MALGEQLSLFDDGNPTDSRAVTPTNRDSADVAACTRVQAPPSHPAATSAGPLAASPSSSPELPITPILPHQSAASEGGKSPPSLTLTTPWSALVDAFLEAALDCPNTQRAYLRHLRDAFRCLKVETVAEVTGAQLAAYRATMMGRSLAPASHAQALAALRSFLRWAGAMGTHQLPSEMVAVALRSPRADLRRPYVILSDPEIGDVLRVTTTARDRALLATLLGAGLRVAEAVALDVRDVIEDVDSGVVLSVRHGKGRKSRLVPIQSDVAQLIRTYLAVTHRHLGEDGALFRAHDDVGHGRRRLSARTVVSIVKREVRRAGIGAKRISPHSMRHAFAIRALRGGGNVVAIAKLLGHATVATTQRYVDHLALGELRQAIPLLPNGDG